MAAVETLLKDQDPTVRDCALDALAAKCDLPRRSLILTKLQDPELEAAAVRATLKCTSGDALLTVAEDQDLKRLLPASGSLPVGLTPPTDTEGLLAWLKAAYALGPPRARVGEEIQRLEEQQRVEQARAIARDARIREALRVAERHLAEGSFDVALIYVREAEDLGADVKAITSRILEARKSEAERRAQEKLDAGDYLAAEMALQQAEGLGAELPGLREEIQRGKAKAQAEAAAAWKRIRRSANLEDVRQFFQHHGAFAPEDASRRFVELERADEAKRVARERVEGQKRMAREAAAERKRVEEERRLSRTYRERVLSLLRKGNFDDAEQLIANHDGLDYRERRRIHANSVVNLAAYLEEIHRYACLNTTPDSLTGLGCALKCQIQKLQTYARRRTGVERDVANRLVKEVSPIVIKSERTRNAVETLCRACNEVDRRMREGLVAERGSEAWVQSIKAHLDAQTCIDEARRFWEVLKSETAECRRVHAEMVTEMRKAEDR